ncbi:MAG: TonB-dependent receptor plug domain-containing protein, partial [Acidobacteria bacterium]|nr:TonB-dependent receptor plug domain-containing protein [Acidobacteriota bacterium]
MAVKSRALGFSLAALAAVALATAGAAAQTTGTIRGTVTDANGNALPGVVVTASGSGVEAEGVSTTDGAFAFTDLAAGDHILTATLFGYAPRELQVTVRAGAVETVPIVLEPAFRLDPLSVVAEDPAVFARNLVAEPMMRQQSNITAVTSVIDNLPGVSVQEGDAYAFDDWSSNVVMRGFQSTINDVQIGTTIDGFPNGTSDYWSGAKANRFVDPMNLGGVEVSQGT